jgi:hypothetical protein
MTATSAPAKNAVRILDAASEMMREGIMGRSMGNLKATLAGIFETPA